MSRCTQVDFLSSSVSPSLLRVANWPSNGSQAAETAMQRLMLLAALGILATTTPGWAQDPRPPVRDSEIVIPSKRALEQDAVTQPRNDFLTNDATATQEMKRQNR
jgi:hypothetical protein